MILVSTSDSRKGGSDLKIQLDGEDIRGEKKKKRSKDIYYVKMITQNSWMSQNHLDFAYTQPNTIIILKDSILHHLYTVGGSHSLKGAPTMNAIYTERHPPPPNQCKFMDPFLLGLNGISSYNE